MATEAENNVELAAALMSKIGVAVEHDTSLDGEAGDIKGQSKDRKSLLHKIVRLCGTPETPKQYYICTKAYSLLGQDWNVIRYAKKYLDDSGRDMFSSQTKEEDGITVNTALSKRAGIMMDLASALESIGNISESYYYYSEAYRYEPYNAMAAIKCAGVLAKLRGKQEALDFLLEQKHGGYYEPVKYIDALGRARSNDLFKRLLDAEILKFSANTEI